MRASLDQVSTGRFLFGIGCGWNAEEMEDHGTVYETRTLKMREQSGSWRMASAAARREIRLRPLISTGWQESPTTPSITSGYISAHIKLCMQPSEPIRVTSWPATAALLHGHAPARRATETQALL
jgi:hypothetical protein